MTATFRDALLNGGRVITKADLYRGDQLLVGGLPVLDGSVNVDVTAAVRRTCPTLVLADPTGTLIPGQAGDPMTPYGNEVKLYRGFTTSAGDEYMPIGVFGLTTTDIAEEDDRLVLTCAGKDRAAAVSAAKLTDVWIVAAGTNVGTAIQALILDGRPGTTFSIQAVADVTPLLIFDAGTDRWEAAQKLAESVGCTLYFDADGVCVIEEEPTAAAVADFTYAEGAASVIASAGKTYSTEDGSNGAIVFGESTSNSVPVRGEAWDTDPTSPTYYLGPYGKRPVVERSEFVTTTSQAVAMATGLMRKNLGGTETVRFVAAPNPAHEGGDSVLVQRAAAKINEIGLLQQFTIPLTVDGKMPGTVRRRRVA
jgi:hypothetical protein